ncbi:hypothetical protein H1Q58_16325 (plasmid) [Planococcus maritimus]|uniref:Uncharacterized protein n=1 Tax=Planococcus maritimus TaxID=192421 RepID=A0A7D7MJ23_PLAMR|nr:hypothetical protein [Planococcus maritimus]QMT19150.1 hypothetical protein H1Q58_16325 [Planococcus maritimus]
MRRFLIVSGLFLFFVVGVFYLVYAKSYYLNFSSQSNIDTPFFVENDVIYRAEDESKIPFDIKGVEVDSAYGPKRGTDYSIDVETWMEWFEQIQQMGANTIRVSTVQDSQFYNAFYQYNTDRENPLYLLQGMLVATEDWKTNKVAENLPFYRILNKDGKDLVDIIHGKKLIVTNDHKGAGLYRHDISPWVVGFLIGDTWNQDLVAYINNTLDQEKGFSGEYVSVPTAATEFETIMAKVIENIISYETEKYGSQRLISVNSSFAMDPFQYQEHYAPQIGKYNSFSMDAIEASSRLKSGLFASYAYESEEIPKPELIKTSDDQVYSDDSNYLEILRQAHDMPAIISSFSHSSSSYINKRSNQGNEIISDLKKFYGSGFNGAFIRSWQDVWNRRVSETSFAVDLQQINEWHDAVTETQHVGLIGFKPYRDKMLMSIDGDKQDWQDVDPSYQKKSTNVTMTRDHAYIYFWIEDSAISAEENMYLALDTHPNLGSKTPDVVEEEFNRNMDFIIEITPDKGGTVYVQDRYESQRENFLEQVTGENPFESYPKKDSSNFQRTKYLVNESEILSEQELNDQEKLYNFKFAEMEPLKLLREEDVEADVSQSEGVLEIRIPYQLLNIYDPLKFTIHDDYYQHYGVSPLRINEFYFTFFTETSKPQKNIEIPVEKLKPSVQVKEYAKPSYEQVKTYWKGEK